VIHETGNVVNSTERSLEVVTNTWWDSFTYALYLGCPTIWHLDNVNSGSSSIFHVTLMFASINISSGETKIRILYIMFYRLLQLILFAYIVVFVTWKLRKVHWILLKNTWNDNDTINW
jgi:hypothetical protein